MQGTDVAEMPDDTRLGLRAQNQLPLVPVVPGDRTGGGGHGLKHGGFRLSMRRNFFPLRVPEPWPRLPREAVESPSLEIFQPRLDKVLGSLLWVTLLGQGVGLGDPQRSLPTPTMIPTAVGTVE